MFRSFIYNYFRIFKQEKISVSFNFLSFSSKNLQRIFLHATYSIYTYVKFRLVSELTVGILAIHITIDCEIWFKNFIQKCNNVILNLNKV